MSKRKKAAKAAKAASPAANVAAIKPAAHPPARQPILLGISIVLFVAWLVFLVVVAWWK
jgi:hypothetical protein